MDKENLLEKYNNQVLELLDKNEKEKHLEYSFYHAYEVTIGEYSRESTCGEKMCCCICTIAICGGITYWCNSV